MFIFCEAYTSEPYVWVDGYDYGALSYLRSKINDDFLYIIIKKKNVIEHF